MVWRTVVPMADLTVVQSVENLDASSVVSSAVEMVGSMAEKTVA